MVVEHRCRKHPIKELVSSVLESSDEVSQTQSKSIGASVFSPIISIGTDPKSRLDSIVGLESGTAPPNPPDRPPPKRPRAPAGTSSKGPGSESYLAITLVFGFPDLGTRKAA